MLSQQIDRREFIKQGAFSLSALTGAALATGALDARALRADDRVSLGRSKLVVSRQGLGLGDGKGEAFQKIGQGGFTRLVRHALDQGVRYFDLLPGPAHGMLAVALKGIPREKYTLVTNFRHPQEQDPTRMIDLFLQELNTDYLDAILVGAILTNDWAKEAKWAQRRDLLSAAKAAGRIRAHGVSVHGWEALNSVAKDSWVELAMVSCNHKGTWMDAPQGKQAADVERRDLSIPLIREIHRAGIGTAGMKIFSHSGYRDAPNPAQERLEAIRYVMALGVIDTMPILCQSIQEFDDVTAMINQAGKEHTAHRP